MYTIVQLELWFFVIFATLNLFGLSCIFNLSETRLISYVVWPVPTCVVYCYRSLWLLCCILFSPPSGGGSSHTRLMRGMPFLMSAFWDQGCHILAGLVLSMHHNKARDCIQVGLEDWYMIILGLYLVRQRHLVSTLLFPFHCAHFILVYLLLDSQPLSTSLKSSTINSTSNTTLLSLSSLTVSSGYWSDTPSPGQVCST